MEYSLFVALFVVVSLGALQFLTDEGEEATLAQIDCVEQRPPTESCQLPAIVTTTTEEPPPIETTVPPPAPTPGVFGWDEAATQSGTLPDGGWWIAPAFRLLDEDGNFVVGATAQLALTVPPENIVFDYVECTTDAQGLCTFGPIDIDFDPNVNAIVGELVYIESPNPVDPLPGAQTWIRP